MNNAEFEVRQILLKEAQEHLFAIEDNLAGLETQALDFRETIDSMLRSAHSLKGGASLMQLDSLSSAAHRLEDALKLLDFARPKLTQEIHTLFLQGIEQLHQIVALNRQGESVDRAWLAEHIDLVFDRLQQKLQEFAEAQPENVVEEFVDISALIFETEVESHLENLEALLASPATLYRLDDELLSIATDLAAIGKMLALENFVQLCESVSQHINAGKHSIPMLSQVALSAWRRSQALVLIGKSESIPSSIEPEFTDLDNIDRPYIHEKSEELFETDLITWLDPTEVKVPVAKTIDREIAQPATMDPTIMEPEEFYDEEETVILIASSEEFISEEDMSQVELWVEEERSPFDLEQLRNSVDLFDAMHSTVETNEDSSLLYANVSDPFSEDRITIADHRNESPQEVESVADEAIETKSAEAGIIECRPERIEVVVADSDREPKICYEENEIFSSDPSLEENLVEEFPPEYSDEEQIASPVTALADVEAENYREEALLEKDAIDRDLIDVGQITHYQEMFLDNEVEISEIFTHETSEEDFQQDKGTTSNSGFLRSLDTFPGSKSAIPNTGSQTFDDSLGQTPISSLIDPDLIEPDLIEMDEAFWDGLDRMLDRADIPQNGGNFLVDWNSESSSLPSEPITVSTLAQTSYQSLEDNLSSSEIYQPKLTENEVQVPLDQTHPESDRVEELAIAKPEVALTFHTDIAPEAIDAVIDANYDAFEDINLAKDIDLSGNITEPTSYGVSIYPKSTNVRLPVSQLENLSRLADGLVISKSNLDMQLSRLKELSRALQRNIRNLDDSQDELHAIYSQAINQLDAKNKENLLNESTYRESNGGGVSTSVIRLNYTKTPLRDRSSQLLALAQSVTEAISQLEETSEGIHLTLLEAEQESASVGHEFSQLVTSINYAKIQPFSDLVSRFPKILHNLSLQYGKQVELSIKGGETLIERAIADALVDPLQHLIRNAFDHGIEDMATRRARGKQERGNIEITASQSAGRILITVRDDGGGIDIEKIRTKAQQTALKEGVDPSPLTQVSEAKLISFIFEPGFSTADRVSALSGRGVGMDVVRANLHQIGADISVASKSGEGTKFTIALPRKSPRIEILLIEVDQMFLATPCNAVQAIIPFTPEDILSKEEESIFIWQDREVPVVRLSDRLKLNCHLNAKQHDYKPVNSAPSMLILQHEQEFMAIPVDACWGKQDAHLHAIEGDISLPDAFSGCLILGNGQPVVLLSPAEISLQWLKANRMGVPSMVYSPQSPSQKRTANPSNVGNPSDSDDVILIVDDSSNTRRNLVLAIEKAGFKTEQAKDGDDALMKIRSGIRVNAIVSDIEMPHIDGYEMLSKLKANEALSHLPVIFLTSSSNETHRQQAMNLGAAAYFCEPYREQELIQTLIQQLSIKS
ncbi:hypothetical protein TUMEXPCC7403_00200 [Tumidithrix helvetica PCC 7403]|uniref:hybrid sensor histidine kinase/response regulator n=1 Tax=Tumidithrix helvetica TaxID=3457545 RepID=UPI003C80D568